MLGGIVSSLIVSAIVAGCTAIIRSEGVGAAFKVFAGVVGVIAFNVLTFLAIGIGLSPETDPIMRVLIFSGLVWFVAAIILTLIFGEKGFAASIAIGAFLFLAGFMGYVVFFD